MHRSLSSKKAYAGAGVGLALVLTWALVTLFSAGASARPATAAKAKPKPTIVLIHGAWANTASWNGVIGRLQAEGYTVYAPPNPLRGLRSDAETIANFLKTIHGPIVLVGHSYGGAVITNAANGVRHVKALVYVDAFAPAKGESAFALTAKFPGSVLNSAPPTQVFKAVPFPGAPKGDALLYVNSAYFTAGFGNDLSAKQRAVAEATQAPVTLSAVTAPSGRPAWEHIPSWYVVGTIDGAIPAAAQMFMAQRAHAHITQVRAGHLSMVSQPGVVAKVITEAAQTVG